MRLIGVDGGALGVVGGDGDSDGVLSRDWCADALGEGGDRGYVLVDWRKKPPSKNA